MCGIIITVCIVVIWDWYNAPNNILSQLFNALSGGKIKEIRLKPPFGCSTCMVFWVNLIVLLCTNFQMCWMALLYAFSSKYILYLLKVIDKFIEKMFIKIDKIL